VGDFLRTKEVHASTNGELQGIGVRATEIPLYLRLKANGKFEGHELIELLYGPWSI
jgi:hypothetical protein